MASPEGPPAHSGEAADFLYEMGASAYQRIKLVEKADESVSVSIG
jgi:hypothetical protein